MGSFAKYTAVDWAIFFQVLLIWFYMAYQTGKLILAIALRKGWRWWNRKDEKLLALDSFYEAFNLEDIQPGDATTIITKSGMTIRIDKPKEKTHD